MAIGSTSAARTAMAVVTAVIAMTVSILGAPAASATAGSTTHSAARAADCGTGVPTPASGAAAVRTVIGVAKTMGIPVKGQIIAVMVMYQESSIRNLANDGTTTQAGSWSWPGRAYWLGVTKLSLRYPHDRFGSFDGAHDTDSIGLFQQRPAWGWGNYGTSTGTTDPAGVVKRLLDPRWEAMAFFGGGRSAAPTSGLLDVNGWENMTPTDAAESVQRSGQPQYYGRWESQATTLVNNNQDAPEVGLPWTPGGGQDARSCAEPLVVSLRAKANNRFVTAEHGGAASLIANRTSVGQWEKFDFIDLGGNRVALRAHANNQFVCADNAGGSPLIANRGAAGPWESFTVVPNADYTVSLRATANAKLVTAENGGVSPLIANRTGIDLWEKFDLVGS